MCIVPGHGSAAAKMATLAAKCIGSHHASHHAMGLTTRLRGGALVAPLASSSARITMSLAALLLAPALFALGKLLLLMLFRPKKGPAPEFGPYPMRWSKLYKKVVETGWLGTAGGAAAEHLPGARKDALCKLITNHDDVLRDICAVTNPKPLSQPDLPRISDQNIGAVDQALFEVARRLMGTHLEYDRALQPSTPAHADVWVQTCKFLHKRIQAVPSECPGRQPDMAPAAAAAMRAVLAEVSNSAAQTLETKHAAYSVQSA